MIASFGARTGEPIAGDYPFFTGEVFWALARLHTNFPDDRWDESAWPIGTYLATARDEEEGYWPDLIDHWAGYSVRRGGPLAEVDPDAQPLTDDEVAYVDRQARLFGATARYEAQRTDGTLNQLVRGGLRPRPRAWVRWARASPACGGPPARTTGSRSSNPHRRAGRMRR